MINIQATDINNALFQLSRYLSDPEEYKVVTVREMETRELHPCMVEITNPCKRTLLYPFRGNNPFASLAETVWVLSGSNKIEWLLPFLPRAKDYSDDGHVWRAGYGKRLRNASGFSGCEEDSMYVDQLKWVYEKLKKDPDTREAVCTIWDPLKECTIGSSLDYPCSDLLQFMIRDGKLDLTVYMRSQDVLWGFSAINVYEWTVLQELMANMLEVPVGKYYHFANSMHIYSQHYNKLESLNKGYNYRCTIPELKPFEFNVTKEAGSWIEPECIKNLYVEVMGDIKDLYRNIKYENTGKDGGEYTFQCFKEVEWYLYLYTGYQLIKKNYPGDNEKLYNHINMCMEGRELTDLRLACWFWLLKDLGVCEPYEIEKALTICRTNKI